MIQVDKLRLGQFSLSEPVSVDCLTIMRRSPPQYSNDGIDAYVQTCKDLLAPYCIRVAEEMIRMISSRNYVLLIYPLHNGMHGWHRCFDVNRQTRPQEVLQVWSWKERTKQGLFREPLALGRCLFCRLLLPFSPVCQCDCYEHDHAFSRLIAMDPLFDPYPNTETPAPSSQPLRTQLQIGWVCGLCYATFSPHCIPISVCETNRPYGLEFTLLSGNTLWWSSSVHSLPFDSAMVLLLQQFIQHLQDTACPSIEPERRFATNGIAYSRPDFEAYYHKDHIDNMWIQAGMRTYQIKCFHGDLLLDEVTWEAHWTSPDTLLEHTGCLEVAPRSFYPSYHWPHDCAELVINTFCAQGASGSSVCIMGEGDHLLADSLAETLGVPLSIFSFDQVDLSLEQMEMLYQFLTLPIHPFHVPCISSSLTDKIDCPISILSLLEFDLSRLNVTVALGGPLGWLVSMKNLENCHQVECSDWLPRA